MKIKIVTYIIEPNSERKEMHKQEMYFSDWFSCKEYLTDRIKLKRRAEFFITEIGEKRISEFNSESFLKLKNIENEFLKLSEIEKQNKENAETKRSGKLSRIEIRIDEKEKEYVLEKCRKLGINISEYTRELYKNGEIRIVPEQFQKDIRGMAINLNQIAKKINTGTISQSGAIIELGKLLIDLKNSISK